VPGLLLLLLGIDLVRWWPRWRVRGMLWVGYLLSWTLMTMALREATIYRQDMEARILFQLKAPILRWQHQVEADWTQRQAQWRAYERELMDWRHRSSEQPLDASLLTHPHQPVWSGNLED
jgi:hypothetical protein